MKRPFLTAHWSDLLLLNFAVPGDVLARLAPPGTEPDLYHGQAFISIVGFRFHTVRLLGLAIPGHTCFPEVNLRFYVRRKVGADLRRGVVFVREIVPRRAVALTANWLYHERYIARPMQSAIHKSEPELSMGDTLEYCWATRGSAANSNRAFLRSRRWNRLAARVAAPLRVPLPNSLEEFFVENYWGYVQRRDGTAHEYQVAHPTWRVAPADDIVWDCDLPATFESPLVEYLAAPPVSALIAAGSAVEVFRGRPCNTDGC